MTFLLGLTGSIGMGKSTTAQMFRDLQIDVWDADAAVHRLYANGGDAVAPIRALYPDAIVDGSVSRPALKSLIANDISVLERIEAIVHPLVQADRASFIENASSDIVVLDIPLLFETKSEASFDAVLVVTVPANVQRERVLARPGMSMEQFDTILARQVPDHEKQSRADYVIQTLNLDQTRQAVTDTVADINKRISNA